MGQEISHEKQPTTNQNSDQAPVSSARMESGRRDTNLSAVYQRAWPPQQRKEKPTSTGPQTQRAVQISTISQATEQTQVHSYTPSNAGLNSTHLSAQEGPRKQANSISALLQEATSVQQVTNSSKQHQIGYNEVQKAQRPQEPGLQLQKVSKEDIPVRFATSHSGVQGANFANRRSYQHEFKQQKSSGSKSRLSGSKKRQRTPGKTGKAASLSTKHKHQQSNYSKKTQLNQQGSQSTRPVIQTNNANSKLMVRHKAELVQNPGKVLKRPAAVNQASSKAVTDVGSQVLQRVRNLQEHVEKIKKLNGKAGQRISFGKPSSAAKSENKTQAKQQWTQQNVYRLKGQPLMNNDLVVNPAARPQTQIESATSSWEYKSYLNRDSNREQDARKVASSKKILQTSNSKVSAAVQAFQINLSAEKKRELQSKELTKFLKEGNTAEFRNQSATKSNLLTTGFSQKQNQNQLVGGRPLTENQSFVINRSQTSQQQKKQVFSNMTSRVIDGHRRQEVLASNSWNSLMIKSERGKATSCISNSSFIAMSKNANLVAQSASFREAPRSFQGGLLVQSSEAHPLGSDRRHHHITSDNQHEEFITEGNNNHKVKSCSNSDLNLSAHEKPAFQNELQSETNDEVPLSARLVARRNEQTCAGNSKAKTRLSKEPNGCSQNSLEQIGSQKQLKRPAPVSNQLQRAKDQLKKMQAQEEYQFKYQIGDQKYLNKASGDFTKSKSQKEFFSHLNSCDARDETRSLYQPVSKPEQIMNKQTIPLTLSCQTLSGHTRNENAKTLYSGPALSQHSAIMVGKLEFPSQRKIRFGADDNLLDGAIAFQLIQFDPSSFHKFLCLSPNWNYLTLDGMDQAFKVTECDFINKYYEHLLFKRSYTNSSMIYAAGKKGMRLDRVLVCEVLTNSKHLNRCLAANFAYKLQARGSCENMATYKLDVLGQAQKRLVWIHRDQTEDQSPLDESYSNYLRRTSEIESSIKQRPLIQPIVQVCEGDVIEIAVNFFSMQGLVDLKSIEWFSPEVSEPTRETVLNYDKDWHHLHPDRIMKIHCDLSRICMVEDSVVEWYDAKYFQGKFDLLNIDSLRSHFKIVSYQCAGVEGLICKIHLLASKVGRLDNPILGMPIVIKLSVQDASQFEPRPSVISASYNDDGEGVLVHEVKRVGFLIDRYVDLHLRVGDSLVVYLQRATA